ncbi:hypothetical protein K1719_001942 [Acacia pycnantha]|nr:hypothetical protein K1719_001942 [Acacia pycnantha]
MVKSPVVSFSPLTLILADNKMENPYLPPEIITNILKRLRVKSLLRFRTVGKDWRNLLKSRSFITEHYHYSPHNYRLLICHVSYRNDESSLLCLLRFEKETVEVERLPAMDSVRPVTALIGSSNGLLCVKLGHSIPDHPPSLFLLNPATREERRVPLSTKYDDDTDIYYHFFGFGYSLVVRDYKIVRIHGTTIHRIWINHNQITLPFIVDVERVEVFSLRTGSWKEVEFSVKRKVRIKSKPVTVNGAIFWLGWEVDERRGLIVSFDLAMEVFTLIPMPSSTTIARIHESVLDVYDNKVAMHHRAHTYICELWMLEEGSCAYGKSWGWTKKRRSTSAVFPERFCRNGRGKLCITDNSGVLFNVTTNNEFTKFLTSLSLSTCDILGRFFYVESLMSMCDMYVE